VRSDSGSTASSGTTSGSGGGGGFSGVDVGGLLLLLITAVARRRQRLGWVDMFSGTAAMTLNEKPLLALTMRLVRFNK
jgi:hypothetical protein